MHPYLARRAGKEKVSYYHDDLKPILERTLGVPLFQEQMLEIATRMTDFTPSEAEELRRALSFHRSQDKMQRVEKKLRAAMERKGYSATIIEEVVAAISSFALYGFPESHAISFAHIAYATAYLKVHRAPEFYVSLLNNQPMGVLLVRDDHQGRPAARKSDFGRCASCGRTGTARSRQDDSIRLGFRVVRGLSSSEREGIVARAASGTIRFDGGFQTPRAS
jgi:error-prone DNA polymerase